MKCQLILDHSYSTSYVLEQQRQAYLGMAGNVYRHNGETIKPQAMGA